MLYDRTDLPERYNAARALRPEVLWQWLDATALAIGAATIGHVLDLGCGTGRFTAGLHDVTGIDPSKKMLAQAPRLARARYIQAMAEAIPLAARSVDLVFMSMVWHHIHDRALAGKEMARVLRAGGFLCIRTSTVESLDSSLYLRFFPQARAISERSLPSRAALLRWAAEVGLEARQHMTIQQETDANLPDHVARISRRGLSDLNQISDADFSSGMERLQDHCERTDRGEPVLETLDLLTFQRA